MTPSTTLPPAQHCVNIQPLTPEDLRKIDAYWRAANYLSVGQIYLYANPLLREPPLTSATSTRSSNNRLFLRFPPRQRCRIFVGAFAESAFHPPGQANRRLAKLVAQMIRGRQGLLPTLILSRLQ